MQKPLSREQRERVKRHLEAFNERQVIESGPVQPEEDESGDGPEEDLRDYYYYFDEKGKIRRFCAVPPPREAH